MRLSTDQRQSTGTQAARSYGGADHTERGDMMLLPSMFNATPSEVAAFRDGRRTNGQTTFWLLQPLVSTCTMCPRPSSGAWTLWTL
jgi:hypothetical protein